MSKVYYFNNRDFGICYTIMTESLDEAINKVKSYILDVKCRPDTHNFELENIELQTKKAAAIKLEDGHYQIEEYNAGEIIETEHS